jgi:predicted Zn-dependent peptidase
MKKIEHRQIAETLYHEKLPNGLAVYLLPKPDFHKTFATLTTKYGSIDNHFQVAGGEKKRVPDGVAHFLEHKMFEQASGEDVFQAFARQGASSNAFTTFTRTAYLFSCTENVEKNVSTLLNFVQSPYFTEQSVEKERGIIGQEIRMYDDNPDWRSYVGLIEALYQQHPVHIEIIGTTESIARIGKETLYDCYNTFYHPSNMLLFLVGPFQPEQMIALIRTNQADKKFAAQSEIKRFFVEEPDGVAAQRKEIELSVGIPKCLFGFKEGKAAVGKEGDAFLQQELVTEIVFEFLVGTGSELYQSLYDDGLIDEGFGYSYSLEKSYGFSVLGGDTLEPERLLARWQQEIPLLVEKGISPDSFARIRKKKIGSLLRALNSPEWIANQFTSYHFNGTDLFRMIPVLEKITIQDVNQRMREHINWNRFAVSLVQAQGS